MIPVICIIVLPLNNRPEKNLDREFWKLERVAYLAMETDIDRDNDQSETSTTHLVFDHHMCQEKGA